MYMRDTYLIEPKADPTGSGKGSPQREPAFRVLRLAS